jgi:hypothetical protein
MNDLMKEFMKLSQRMDFMDETISELRRNIGGLRQKNNIPKAAPAPKPFRFQPAPSRQISQRNLKEKVASAAFARAALTKNQNNARAARLRNAANAKKARNREMRLKKATKAWTNMMARVENRKREENSRQANAALNNLLNNL